MNKLLQLAAYAAIATTFALSAKGQTNSLYSDLGNLFGDIGLSANPTNYAAASGLGMRTDAKEWAAWALVTENVNNYVGVCGGVDYLWGGGKTGSENIVSGGLTLNAPTYPLRCLASSTNSFTYTLKATPYAIALVGTPVGSTGNGGGLASIVRAGASVDVYNIKGWQLAIGADYGTRSGAGNYNGKWLDALISIRKGF